MLLSVVFFGFIAADADDLILLTLTLDAFAAGGAAAADTGGAATDDTPASASGLVDLRVWTMVSYLLI